MCKVYSHAHPAALASDEADDPDAATGKLSWPAHGSLQKEGRSRRHTGRAAYASLSATLRHKAAPSPSESCLDDDGPRSEDNGGAPPGAGIGDQRIHGSSAAG